MKERERDELYRTSSERVSRERVATEKEKKMDECEKKKRRRRSARGGRG